MSAPRLDYLLEPATMPAARHPVVLLPVAFAGGWIWDDTSPGLLRGGFDVVRVREPFARLDSSVVGSIDSLSDCVRELLDHLAVSKAVICGNSLGGLVALVFASRHPDRIQSLVVSGAPGLTNGTNLRLGAPRTPTREFADAAARHLFCDPACLPAGAIESTLALVSERRVLRNVISALRAARTFDVAPLLASIRARTLFIWGENDAVTPVDAWHRAVDSMADARIQTIPRCGHAPMIELPRHFNSALLGFLAESGADGPGE